MTTEPAVVTKFVDSTHSSQGMIFIVDEFGGSGLDVFRCDGIDAAEDLCRCHATSIRQELSANILGNIGMSVQAHQHGGLQVKLGTFNFFIRRSVDQTDQVVHDRPHAVIYLDVRANDVDTKETSILVASVEGAKGVCQFVFSDFLTQTGGVVLSNSHGTVVGSKHDLHQHERESVLGSPRSGFVGDGNVGCIVRVELDSAALNG